MTCRLNYNIFDFEQIWRYFLKNLSTWVQLVFEVEHDFFEGLSSRGILKLSWRFSNLVKFEATFWKIWLPGCNSFLKLSMIFLEASPRGWFWNLLGDSPTWPNFKTHKTCDVTKILLMLKNFIVLKLTYPSLKNFKGLFCALIIIIIIMIIIIITINLLRQGGRSHLYCS